MCRYGAGLAWIPDKYLDHGSIVIAAITRVRITSNPYVMMRGAAGEEGGGEGAEYSAVVKTSLAPGSRVVTDYSSSPGLMPYLDKLRFRVVGYGCTTCIGNSGPLPSDVSSRLRTMGWLRCRALRE